MSRPFKKCLIDFAIAFPIALALRLLAPALLPTVACVWQAEDGDIQRAKGKVCDRIPEHGVVLRTKD